MRMKSGLSALIPLTVFVVGLAAAAWAKAPIAYPSAGQSLE